MDLSVIIPTRGRAAKLLACVGCLGRQDLPFDRFEVLIGVDGEDDGQTRGLAEGTFGHLRAVVYEFPRVGLAAVRNGLVKHARGRILLSINDDVLPEPAFCRAHVEAHEQRRRAGQGPAAVVGDSPWVVHHPDRLFDRLIRETSMIFFYDQMTAPTTPHSALRTPHSDHDWGFRHAFGLNVSYPTDAVREVGGYAVFPVTYGYEDTEIAFRLKDRFGAPVLFRPAARAHHDHRYEPAGYLERERVLGHAAWGFAHAAPACAKSMFGRDITSESEIATCRRFVEQERAAIEPVRAWFLALAASPADSVSGPDERERMRLAYEKHLPLKRWEWRTGLLKAAARA